MPSRFSFEGDGMHYGAANIERELIEAESGRAEVLADREKTLARLKKAKSGQKISIHGKKFTVDKGQAREGGKFDLVVKGGRGVDYVLMLPSGPKYLARLLNIGGRGMARSKGVSLSDVKLESDEVMGALSRLCEGVYDRAVTDPAHKPKKLASTIVSGLKKGIGRGTKVEVVKAEATMTRGWDYGFHGVFKITLPDGDSLRASFVVHFAKGEVSGNAQLDAKYGGVVSNPRASKADRVIESLISDVSRHLKRKTEDVELTEAGFTKGQRVTTPLGAGNVAYQRMAPPNYSKPASVSVVLDKKKTRSGYTGTVFKANDVKPLKESALDRLRANVLAEARLPRSRARKIVEMAAGMVRDRQAKEWLTRDEKGTWEKTAMDLYDKASKSPKFASASEKEVDKEIAIYLASLAVEARLRRARAGG